MDDASFSVENFCQDSTNSAIITGLENGIFSLVNSNDEAIINPVSGELSNTSLETDYQIMYQTNGNCPNTSIQSLSVLPLDDASFSINNFCFGSANNAEIIGYTDGQFSLLNNTDEAVIDIITGEISNEVSGNIYNVQYMTNGSINTCPNSSQQMLEVYPLPNNLNIISHYEYCANELIDTISILPQNQNSTINWYFDESLDSIIIQSNDYLIPFSLGNSTVYVNEITENNCQGNFVEITQIINPVPEIYAGEDTTICHGEYITLNANGGINYIWNNGIQNNVPFTYDTGIHEFIVSGNNTYNCNSFDTVEVIVHENPLTFAGENINVCGLNHQLNASDNGNYGFWTANNAKISSINSPITSVTNNFYGSNTFTWTETNSFGCISSSSVLINF